jgi:hypothetical protein
MPKPPPPAQPDSGITPLRSGPTGTYTESRWQSAPFWMEKCIFLSEEMETKKGHLTRELLTANKEPLGWCILNRPQVVHFNRPVRIAIIRSFLHPLGNELIGVVMRFDTSESIQSFGFDSKLIVNHD